MGSQIRKNTIYNAVGNLVYLAAQWLVTILVARLFGLGDAGILSLAMSISASFQTVALFGIRNFQVSDLESKYSDSCYVGFRAVTCASAMILCVGFALLNGYAAGTITAIVLFMLFRLAENYSDVLHGIFQKNDMLYKAGLSLLIKGAVLLIGFGAGFLLTGTLNGSLAAMTLAALAVTFFFDFFGARKISGFSLKFDVSRALSLAKETAPLCLYLFLNSIIATAPKYILDKMSDDATLGAYSSIFAPLLVIQAAAQYIYMPFITRFAELYRSKDIKGFISLAGKIVTAIVVLGVVIFSAALFAGKWGLTLLLGEAIAPYCGLLSLIIVGTFCTALNAFVQALAVVIRDFRGLVISCVTGAAVCCVLSYAAIGGMGADGASVGLIAGTVTGTVILTVKIHCRLSKVGGTENEN